MAANPVAIGHILVTTNTAGIAAILTATIAAWIIMGKPDLGMSINGLLAGLVIITPTCAYVSVPVSLLLGAVSGVVVVLAVMMFDKLKLDDPVGALAVHLCNGTLGTLAVGLFAKDGVGGTASANGLFYGGGWSLLGAQALGVLCVGGFVFTSSLVVWFILKKTVGIRVSLKEEIEGLDIGEHGNQAYPEFATHKLAYSVSVADDK